MMHRSTLLAGMTFLLVGTGPLAAQEADTVAPAAQATVEAAPAIQEQTAHDWEFTLYSGDLTQASGKVMVTENEGKNDFVVVASGLPPVDSLDQDERDVNAYTVWIVPGRDRIIESTLAGVLVITPDGEGRFEGATDLEIFGVAIAATPDGAPGQIARPVVLSGIPKEEGAPESAEEAGEDEAAPAAPPDTTTSATP
jgi:hypothetical protein